jgi:monofunctional biosynthetic peptidoglycan transglycosylase
MNINLKVVSALIIKLVLTLFLLSIVWVLIYKWLPPPATLHMFKKRAEAGQKDKPNRKISYSFVDIDEVSVQVPLALIAAEDQLFLQHNGFDVKAMKGAFKSNLNGKRLAGGSTISQQVAKNVFLWHGRSYLRKGVEAYFTLLIELLWSKKRIMEVYLNIAEMGDQVFGVAAASRKFFNKDPRDLTRQQAALIASVLPNPIKYSVKKPSVAILRKRSRVVRNMKRLGGAVYVRPITQAGAE